MTTWRSNPQFKVTVGGTDYINEKALSLQITRPENNIAFAVLKVDDYKSVSYVDIFDAFTAIDISLRYGSDSWTQVFSGTITTVAPNLSTAGEILEVGAWGEGLPLLKTHCDTTYGVESQNPTLDTPQEILQDLITNYVNKEFVDAATGWSLGNTKVENVHSGLSVTHLPSKYANNFVMVNRICDLANAYAQGLGTPEVSIHWFVDENANLYVKKIDADHSDGNWDRYWGGTQANSTITVKKDMVLYDFKKNVEEYANRILLCTDFRKPGYDYWAEDADTTGLWDESDGDITLSDDTTNYIVGSDSLKFTAAANKGPDCFYPTTAANWDFTKISSENNPAYISFYARRTNNAHHAVTLELWTTNSSNYFFRTLFNTASDTSLMPNDSEWYHLEFPLLGERWGVFGSPDWANIDFINILFNNTGYAGANDFWLDDLHFRGKIIRDASDTSEIAANNEYQRVIRNDTAVDDSMVASDDSGMAGRLAYAELLRRSQTPIVAVIQIPMAIDILPGQTVAIDACQKSDDSYRIDQDFRIKEVNHIIGPPPVGFRTSLNLTSDVTNTHAFGAPTPYSLLIEYASALGHSEARDLKGGGIDPLIPRLEKTY